ncbi:hypothetical protein P7C71_g502, partial [Lecanoromycetidae sp. Uapishka_2]
MTSTQPNPRRCYKTRAHPAFASTQPTSTQDACLPLHSAEPNLQLKKSATFHSPKSPPSDDDPILSIRRLSRRSPTSHRDLEDAVAAGEQRIAQLLGSVDRSLSGLESFSSDSQETLRQEEAPVPRFMLGPLSNNSDCMDVDYSCDGHTAIHKVPQRADAHRHTSDSGLGSSMSSTEESLSGEHAAHTLTDYKNIASSTVTEICSGINGANTETHVRTQSLLSKFACKQIQDYIIIPILKEKRLKPFHHLVRTIPIRVSRKEITCLRDLEKVILWLAPVRQYAAMINQQRERLAAGRTGEIGDYFPLRGGLGETGHPAGLVRIRDGQATSLRTGQIVPADAYRRSSSEDDDLELSMARRKKSEMAAAKHSQRCSECDKEFKRPCDLTKHEKTHSRPWKCNEPSCKYSQYGWPTEKERDRHVNDKHSVTPNMYRCNFAPCPYESKRESNCKQHMEKAHGWAYVRSKNNGKTGRKPSKNASSKTPPTPQMTTPGSNIFDGGSEFGETASSYMHSSYNASSIGASTRASTSPYVANNGYLAHSRNVSSGEDSRTSESPFLGTTDTLASFNHNYGWDESLNRLTPQTPYTPDSHRLSIDSFTNPSTMPSSYEMQDDPTLFGGEVDWNNMDFTSMNITIDDITPLTSVDTYPVDVYSSRNPSISAEHSKNPNLSPGAQGHQMLFAPSPYSNDVDEGYSEFTNNVGKNGGDFALFDDSSMGPSATMPLFNDLHELPPFQPTTWSGRGTDLARQLGINDMQLDED